MKLNRTYTFAMIKGVIKYEQTVNANSVKEAVNKLRKSKPDADKFYLVSWSQKSKGVAYSPNPIVYKLK